MSIKARLTELLLHMQQSRSDIYGCQVSGGQIEKVYHRSQPNGANQQGIANGSLSGPPAFERTYMGDRVGPVAVLGG